MVKVTAKKILNVKNAIKKPIRIDYDAEFLDVLKNHWTGKEFSAIKFCNLVLENGIVQEEDRSGIIGNELLYYELPGLITAIVAADVDVDNTENVACCCPVDFFTRTDEDVVLNDDEFKMLETDIDAMLLQGDIIENWKRLRATHHAWKHCIGKTVDAAIGMMEAVKAQRVLVEHHLAKKKEEEQSVACQIVEELHQQIAEYDAARAETERRAACEQKVAEAQQVIAEHEAVAGK